jgi:hypothetical protein
LKSLVRSLRDAATFRQISNPNIAMTENEKDTEQLNLGVAYLRDDFASFVGWASCHWCQLKLEIA